MSKTFRVFIGIFFILTSIVFADLELKLLPKFRTDTTKYSIDLNKIFNGGPDKDGIPALNKPLFNSIENTKLLDDTLGVLVKLDNIVKFYPYNILVWHELVNDSIGEQHFVVSFCPLCGSAIVFNRKFNGKIHKFGVSGFLYESNMLMYDDFTESFWSQSKGEAVVGSYLRKKLELMNMSVINFGSLKRKYPNALVLSRNTGYIRDYDFYPYGDYENNAQIIFPTSKSNKKYHPKEMMYVFRYKNRSFAFLLDKFKSEKFVYKYRGKKINIFNNDGEIVVEIEGKVIPAYYEMWFSWVIHNERVGVVIDKIN